MQRIIFLEQVGGHEIPYVTSGPFGTWTLTSPTQKDKLAQDQKDVKDALDQCLEKHYFIPKGCKHIARFVGKTPKRILRHSPESTRATLHAIESALLQLSEEDINFANVIGILFRRWDISNYYHAFKDKEIVSIVLMLLEKRKITDILREIDSQKTELPLDLLVPLSEVANFVEQTT